MSFQVGETVDHYRLDEVVAQHASMTVYAAFDLRLLRKVALNELPAELVTGESVRARFTGEAAAAAQLDHPNIVPVYDSNEHDGSLYFVTKFIDGVTLSELHRSSPATLAESMIYLDQLASALDYIHRRGVVHGSVRPSNVLIATGELPHSAQLFDVGITTRIQAEPDSANWFATAEPARVDAEGRRVDAEGRRVDVVGLARTAFELLTRRAPQDALASASMIDRQLPPAVDSVFADVLGGERDMTCGQFVAALRRALPADLLVDRSPLAAAIGAPEPVASARSAAVPRRSPAVLAASIAAAVVLVLGMVWWQGSGSTNADEATGSVAPPTQQTPPTTVLPPTTSERLPPTAAAPTTAAGRGDDRGGRHHSRAVDHVAAAQSVRRHPRPGGHRPGERRGPGCRRPAGARRARQRGRPGYAGCVLRRVAAIGDQRGRGRRWWWRRTTATRSTPARSPI